MSNPERCTIIITCPKDAEMISLVFFLVFFFFFSFVNQLNVIETILCKAVSSTPLFFQLGQAW